MPESFRFSAKMPKAITHTQKLREAEPLLDAFLAEAGVLEEKLACLLVQLPPSLVFDAAIAAEFFKQVRARTPVAVVCEPRHESWFATEAEQLLRDAQVARVAADPPRAPAAASPGGWRGMSYYRLHGSPKMYYSAYSADFISALAAQVREDAAADRDAWVIFDNTTLGAATGNALELAQALQE